MKPLKKSGFTLMELLVYMAIVGIVVIVAGQAFSNSTKFRIRTDNMIKATQEAENVGTLFKEDLEQMGAKSSKESSGAGGSSDVFSTLSLAQDVYMKASDVDASNIDKSSYKLIAGTNDEIIFRRFRFDDAGHFVAVEEIGWFVENKTLKRSCRTISPSSAGTDYCPSGKTADQAKADAVNMATGVSKFNVTPAMPGVQDGSVGQLFPYCSAEPCPKAFRMVAREGGGDYIGLTISSDAETHKIVHLSGFVTNYDNNTNAVSSTSPRINQVYAIGNSDGTGSWSARCSEAGNHFTLEKNTLYELSFDMINNADKSRMFIPGTDHMAVGFRTQDGAKPAGIDDFMFFPPATDQASGTRTMRFTVPNKIENVCIAFTFACYSPLVANGRITISDLLLKKVETANYSFNYASSKEFPIKDKERVKAFKMEMQVNRGDKNGASGETGNVVLIIPTPSNGPYD